MTESGVGLEFAADVFAVAARYGVPDEDVALAPSQGQVNLTVFLGTDLVLRIPRNVVAARRLPKEAQVIPLVQDAGVPTADLVAYDATLQITTVPYLVLTRLHGATMAGYPYEPSSRRRARQSLGEILVALHRIRLSTMGSVADTVPAPFTFSPVTLVQRLQEAGEIGSAQRDWLLERFDLLQPQGPSQDDPVLLHRDVTPSNLIVDKEGRVSALLDWGCAEWGSPARDLVGLPPQALPVLLSGYRSALSVVTTDDNDADTTLEQNALWYHLYLALARLLKAPSTAEDQNWAAPRHATILDLLALVSGQDSWPDLLHRTSSRP